MFALFLEFGTRTRPQYLWPFLFWNLFGTKDEIRPGNHVSPFLAWGDFHARSRFARSTLPEEKWGTTRSLGQPGQPGSCEEALNPLNPEIKI